jgi:PAS domain S-box-containing protein
MTSQIRKLRIQPRLILCFVFIILFMLLGNCVLAWQLLLVRQQSDRVTALAQELAVVSRFHTDLLSLDAALDSLTKSEDLEGLRREATRSRSIFITDFQAIRDVVVRLPPEIREDAAPLPTVEAVETTWSPQLDALIALGATSDWNAVRLRLGNEREPLESRASDLVRSVQQRVTTELVQSVVQSEQIKRRVLVVLPLTALLTLAFATLLGIEITRSITVPLDQLMESATALARGDFTHRVQFPGDDELTRLGAVFNETSTKLGELTHELRRRESYLAEAQRLNHTGSLAYDPRTMVAAHWSRECLRIWGFDPDSGPPMTEDMLRRIHPEDRDRVQEYAENAIRSKEAFSQEFKIVLPDGTIKHIHSANHLLIDNNGEPIEVLGTHVDITERKRIEQEHERLRQLEAELAHINRVNMMGELTASISHELAQPIMASTINAKASLRWLQHDPPNAAQARNGIEKIIEAGNFASEIIDRLRSLYKKAAPIRELVAINEVAEEMAGMFRSEASRRGISIRTDLRDDLPLIVADRVQIQQVFMNLMMNSIEAMGETGGMLTIESQSDARGQIQVSVSDTGLGLPLGPADQLFDAFFTTKPQGSGMGLSISNSIVKAHGGRIWATANEERGATFHFTLFASARESTDADIVT